MTESELSEPEQPSEQVKRLMKGVVAISKSYGLEKKGSDTARRSEVRKLVEEIAAEESNS
jgi:hypothetical protein